MSVTAVFWIVLGFFVLHELGRWLITRSLPRRRILIQESSLVTRVCEWLLLAAWGFCLIGYLSPWRFVIRKYPDPIIEWLLYLGLALLPIGSALQLVAKKQLGGNWSHAVHGPTVHKGPITEHGLYRWSRNPMYCGTLIFAFALVCILQEFVPFVIAVFSYVYVYSNIEKEEEILLKMKEDVYRRYCERVPRFFFRLPRTVKRAHV